MKRITVEMLRKHHACEGQVELFEETFPKGAPVTMRSLAKAQKVGLDVLWCERLLTGPASAEYKKVVRQASAEYKKVVKQASAEYKKVVRQASAECEKVTAQARAEYEKVEGQAWAEYKKVVRQASAEYEKVEGQAWAEYVKVTRPALVAALAQEKQEVDNE